MGNTAVISLKVEKTLKDDAMAVAKDLGMPLATYLKMCLKRLKDEQSIHFQRSEVFHPEVAQELKDQMIDLRMGKNVIKGGKTVEDLKKALLSD